MAEKRVALLVPEGIRDWIAEEIDRLCLAHEAGVCHLDAYNPDTKNPRAPKISVAAFLEMMLESRLRHRTRRRAAAAARQAKRVRRPARANVEAHQNADRG